MSCAENAVFPRYSPVKVGGNLLFACSSDEHETAVPFRLYCPPPPIGMRGPRRQEEEGGWSAGDGSGNLGKLRHSMEKLQEA